MSKIEWTDKTWNPVRGCAKIAPGCKNCYAIPMSARIVAMGRTALATKAKRELAESYAGVLNDDLDNWNGKVQLVPEALMRPLSWRKGLRIFVNSMGDLFHEDVPNEFIAAVFAVMLATPRHRYVVLTKRPKRALEWFEWLSGIAAKTGWSASDECRHWLRAHLGGLLFAKFAAKAPDPGDTWPAPNVAIGVSVSDQETWDTNVPLLLEIPARWRIVSAEPLLGPVDVYHQAEQLPVSWPPVGIDQVIIGAESGPGARPCQLDWIQGLARQVLDAKVPLFFKQGDVCGHCDGRGDGALGPGGHCRCTGCGTGGLAGKVRKKSPRLYVPGHGTQQWQQFPEGWI